MRSFVAVVKPFYFICKVTRSIEVAPFSPCVVVHWRRMDLRLKVGS